MPLSSHRQPVDRRRHWSERRSGTDRRNPARISHDIYDCRTGIQRRTSDIGGELDADMCWDEHAASQYARR